MASSAARRHRGGLAPRARGFVGRLAACSAALLVLGGSAPSALADGEVNERPEQPFEITQEVLSDSITRYDPTSSITRYDAADSVTSLGETEPDEDQLIVLETDILFASNTWELPDSARDRIAGLVADIPEGATVDVGGHTDSRPVDQSLYDFDNQQLSQNRAQAVADAVATERDDLTLEVEGFGATEPAVTEDPDDPSTFAANRRVELRYGD